MPVDQVDIPLQKSSPTAHLPSDDPFTCHSPLPEGVCPAIVISLVLRLTIPSPVGFSRVPDEPQPTLLTRIGRIGGLLRSTDLPVTHNSNSNLILCNDCFVSNPFIFRLRDKEDEVLSRRTLLSMSV